MTTNARAIIAKDLGKTFTMHLQGGQELPVIESASFTVEPGELIVLGGASGSGKSSIMKMIYGNYAITSGSILVAHDGATIDMATASPRLVTQVRARSLGYVSQFLRVVPRVPAREIVAEPLLAWGVEKAEALERAEAMLTRLNVPQTLWNLPPATFSGGEQQRVNIARGLISEHPILLLDEPTASLDATNRSAVIDLIEAKREAGVAMLGIFHDADTRARVATRVVDVEAFRPSEADEAA